MAKFANLKSQKNIFIYTITFFIIILFAFLASYLLINLKWNKNFVLKDVETINDEKESLYGLFRSPDNIFLTLDLQDATDKNFVNKNKFNLSLLHAGEFWNPGRCSQMQNIIAQNKIIFSDVRVEDNDLVSYVFVYDIEENILKKFVLPAMIEKLYESEGKIYFLTKNLDKEKNIWKLYNLDLINKSAFFTKEFVLDTVFNLNTNVNTLTWTNLFGKDVFQDDFIKENNGSIAQVLKDSQDPYFLEVFKKNKNIISLSKADKIKFYYLGFND